MQKFLPSLALLGKVAICVIIIHAAAQLIPGLSGILFDPVGTVKGKIGGA